MEVWGGTSEEEGHQYIYPLRGTAIHSWHTVADQCVDQSVENTGEVEDRGAHSAYPLLQRALCEDGGIHVLIPWHLEGLVGGFGYLLADSAKLLLHLR